MSFESQAHLTKAVTAHDCWASPRPLHAGTAAARGPRYRSACGRQRRQMPQQLPGCERGLLLLPSTRSEHACAEEDGSAPTQVCGKRLLRGTMDYHVQARLPPAMQPPCAPARAGGRVSSHRKLVRTAAERGRGYDHRRESRRVRSDRMVF